VDSRRRLFILLCLALLAAPFLFPGRADAGITVATSLSSFSGIENPQVIYDPTTQTFSPNTYQNIVDEGNGEFRFSLRYDPPNFWDGSNDTTLTDRQRAEVKGLGPYQLSGQTYEYSFSFETDPNFVGTSGFCHIFQLKAINSAGEDPGLYPVVTLSLMSGNQGRLELYSPEGAGDVITDCRKFTYSDNTWETAQILITTSIGDTDTGSVMASINGDPMSGVSNVPVLLDGYDTYRPKWGFYRGIDSDLYVGTNYIQDENISADAISVPEPASIAMLSFGAITLLARRRATL
jgi:hypothetical protein